MIKYGELTTKKDNRKEFIKILTQNIQRLIKDDYEIIKDNSRMYIKCNDAKKISEKLRKVFGIHGISIVHEVNNNYEEVLKKSLEIMDDSKKTFKVVTKRSDKTFNISSMEYSRHLGGLILKNSNYKVDVHNPDIVLNIEIRKEGTYIYTDELKGIGGYPVGVQGKGILMLSGGIDSPVAGYLAMKRGINIEGLYFESPPHTSEEAKNKVIELSKVLNEYSGKMKLHIVPFTKIQEEIYKNCPSNYMITIMRRMMYRIAERYAEKIKAKIIINGESIGQVASQTLDSIACINKVVTIPVIRPVATFDKLEIIDIAKQIKTYDISILPYEDCCTVFVLKHPVIKPEISKAEEYEKLFDFESLIDECIKNIKTVTNFEENFEELL
ncbi:MAG: tRNA 4-thiouridine(8) synthase ThiI [Bacilli bacterium]|nr:tRNA 4-thiouridine(8) synthase ThiI [Bacilli bacterium]